MTILPEKLAELRALEAAATEPMPRPSDADVAAWGDAEKSEWLATFNTWMASVRAAEKAIAATIPDLLSAFDQQQALVEKLREENEAFERAFRIRVWNACRASNMMQDAAIRAVEKAVNEIRAALAQPSEPDHD